MTPAKERSPQFGSPFPCNSVAEPPTRLASTQTGCEHLFVTSQGSAYSQFKRALDRRNFLLAWTTAAELPKVPLADALSLLLLALDQQPWRFERAAPRWHARLCAEARLTLPEAQLALAALQALPPPALSPAVRLSSPSVTRTVSMMRSGSSTRGWTPTTDAN
jgi:hypothetical protein